MADLLNKAINAKNMFIEVIGYLWSFMNEYNGTSPTNLANICQNSVFRTNIYLFM